MTNHETFLEDQFQNYLFIGDIDSAKLLLADGIEINNKGTKDTFPIIAAINSEDPKVLNFIISNGGKVNIDIGDGWTPLHVAFDFAIDGMLQNNKSKPYQEAMEMIEILLKNGADLDAKNAAGQTPLELTNIYTSNIDNFNSLKDIFKNLVPDIDSRLHYDKNGS